jgi:serine/threonine protein kinase
MGAAEARSEELEALQAIYGSELRILRDDDELHFEVDVHVASANQPANDALGVRLRFHLPQGYPSGGWRARARVGVSAGPASTQKWSLSPNDLEVLRRKIQSLCEEAARARTSVGYEVVELARTFLREYLEASHDLGEAGTIVRPLHEAMLEREQRQFEEQERAELERTAQQRERLERLQQQREEAERLQTLEALAAEERLARKLQYQRMAESSTAVNEDGHCTAEGGSGIAANAHPWDVPPSWTILEALRETLQQQSERRVARDLDDVSIWSGHQDDLDAERSEHSDGDATAQPAAAYERVSSVAAWEAASYGVSQGIRSSWLSLGSLRTSSSSPSSSLSHSMRSASSDDSSIAVAEFPRALRKGKHPSQSASVSGSPSTSENTGIFADWCWTHSKPYRSSACGTSTDASSASKSGCSASASTKTSPAQQTLPGTAAKSGSERGRRSRRRRSRRHHHHHHDRVPSSTYTVQQEHQQQVLKWFLESLCAQMTPDEAAAACARWHRKLGIVLERSAAAASASEDCDDDRIQGIPSAPLMIQLNDDRDVDGSVTNLLSFGEALTRKAPDRLEATVKRVLGSTAWHYCRQFVHGERFRKTSHGRAQQSLQSGQEKERKAPLSLTSHTHAQHTLQLGHGEERRHRSLLQGNVPPAGTPKRTSRFETDFDMLELLGRGGFGAVVKVRQRLDGRIYAVKIVPLHRKDLEDPRILRETTTLSRLAHPRCVRYYGCWVEPIDVLRFSEALSSARTGAQDSQRALGAASAANTSAAQYQAQQQQQQPSLSLASLVLREQLSYSMPSSDTTGATSAGPESSSAIVAFLFIQMEYCPRTLRAFIDQDLDAGTDLWQVFRQIVEGVEYLHSLMLIHRDLKPTNIFVGGPRVSSSPSQGTLGDRLSHTWTETESISIKIGDFGLATTLSVASLRRAPGAAEATNARGTADAASADGAGETSAALELTRSVGTAFYRAPELSMRPASNEQDTEQPISSSPTYDTKVDIYALGVILFELFYGPMQRTAATAAPGCKTSGDGSSSVTEHERFVILTNLRERLQVPAAFAEKLPRQTRLIRLLMAKNPDERPSAKQLLKMLPVKVEHEYWSELLQAVADPVSTVDRRLRTRVIGALFEGALRGAAPLVRKRDIHQAPGESSYTSSGAAHGIVHSCLEASPVAWNCLHQAVALLQRHQSVAFVLQHHVDAYVLDSRIANALRRVNTTEAHRTRHQLGSNGTGGVESAQRLVRAGNEGVAGYSQAAAAGRRAATPVLLPTGEYVWLPAERFHDFLEQWMSSSAAVEALTRASIAPPLRFHRVATVWGWRSLDAPRSFDDPLAGRAYLEALFETPGLSKSAPANIRSGERLVQRRSGAMSAAASVHVSSSSSSSLACRVRSNESSMQASRSSSMGIVASDEQLHGAASALWWHSTSAERHELFATTLLEFDELQLKLRRRRPRRRRQETTSALLLVDAELLFMATSLLWPYCPSTGPMKLVSTAEQRTSGTSTSTGRRGSKARQRQNRRGTHSASTGAASASAASGSASMSTTSVEKVLIRIGHTGLTRALTRALLTGSSSSSSSSNSNVYRALEYEDVDDQAGALAQLRAALHQHLRLGWNGLLRMLATATEHPWNKPSAQTARRHAEQLVHACQQLAPLSMLQQLATSTAVLVTGGQAAFVQAALVQLERVLCQWALLLDHGEWLAPFGVSLEAAATTTTATATATVVVARDAADTPGMSKAPVAQPWPPQGPVRVLVDPFLWPVGAASLERFTSSDQVCFEASLITTGETGTRHVRPVLWGGHWQRGFRAPQPAPASAATGASKGLSMPAPLTLPELYGCGFVVDLSLLAAVATMGLTSSLDLSSRLLASVYVGMLRESTATTVARVASASVMYLVLLGHLWRQGWCCIPDDNDDDDDNHGDEVDDNNVGDEDDHHDDDDDDDEHSGNDTHGLAGRSLHEHLQRAGARSCRFLVLIRAHDASVLVRERLVATSGAEGDSLSGTGRLEKARQVWFPLEQAGQYTNVAQRVAQTLHDLLQRQDR